MPRIPDSTRDAIRADLAGGESQRAVADRHGVSISSVAKIRREHTTTDSGEPPPAVAESYTFDPKATRARLVEGLYADAQRFRDRAWGPYTQVVVTPQGAETITVDLPPLRDQAAGYSALATCIDRAMRMEAHDTDGEGGLAAVDEWLRSIVGT